MARSENDPAVSSSSDEEEEEEEEDEEVSSEGSESESEPENTPTPPPSSKKPQSAPNSSSSESETESESESDTDPPPKKPDVTGPKVKVKPLASTPMDTDSLKKPRSKNPTSRYSPPPLKPSAGKRTAPEGEAKDSKRARKKAVIAVAAPDADGGSEKKQLFQRLWSEDDEIELVQGMINYVEEKGKDPIADLNDFHEFVKKSLHVDVNSRQMSTKVRRLKKKFENNAARFEKTGKVRSFSNPHEKKMYELSKNLWGSDSNKKAVLSSPSKKAKAAPKSNKVQKNEKGAVSGNGGLEVSAVEVEQNVVQSESGLGQVDSIRLPITDEDIMNKGLGLLSGAKKVELEEKWKNLKMQEIEHFIRKCELMKEQAKLVLNAIRKSGAN